MHNKMHKRRLINGKFDKNPTIISKTIIGQSCRMYLLYIKP